MELIAALLPLSLGSTCHTAPSYLAQFVLDRRRRRRYHDFPASFLAFDARQITVGNRMLRLEGLLLTNGEGPTLALIFCSDGKLISSEANYYSSYQGTS